MTVRTGSKYLDPRGFLECCGIKIEKAKSEKDKEHFLASEKKYEEYFFYKKYRLVYEKYFGKEFSEMIPPIDGKSAQRRFLRPEKADKPRHSLTIDDAELICKKTTLTILDNVVDAIIKYKQNLRDNNLDAEAYSAFSSGNILNKMNKENYDLPNPFKNSNDRIETVSKELGDEYAILILLMSSLFQDLYDHIPEDGSSSIAQKINTYLDIKKEAKAINIDSFKPVGGTSVGTVSDSSDFVASTTKKLQKISSFNHELLNTARISYNKKASDQYSCVKTLLSNKQPIQLSKTYIRLPLKGPHNEWISTNNPLKLEQQYGNRLLITGSAGSGKSLMLRYMFLRVLKRNHNQIPVFLSLRNLDYSDLFTDESTFLPNQMYFCLKKLGFDVSEDLFTQSLTNLSYILFLDGFDEVSYTVRNRLKNIIDDFSQHYKNITFIISSRPESSFVSWDTFTELQIRPLTRSLIKIFIEKNSIILSKKQPLLDEVELIFQRRLKYMEFLRSPLLLSIVCISYDQFGKLPERISQFYDQAFATLYNWQDKNKPGFIRNLESDLSYSDFKNLIEYMCFKAYFKNEFSFSEKTLSTYIQKAIDKGIVSKETLRADIILSDLVDSISILVRDGVNYVFVHKSFQEYFAAVYLERTMIDDTQVHFFSSWLREQRITYSNLFLDILYECNPDRFISNIIVPGVDELEKKYLDSGCSDEYLIRLLLGNIYIRNHKSLGLKYPVARINDVYYNHIILRTCRIGKEDSILSNRSVRVLGLNNEKLKELATKHEKFISSMISLYGYNTPVSQDELKAVGLYDDFLASCYWVLERYDFTIQFVKKFKSNKHIKGNSYQAILDQY